MTERETLFDHITDLLVDFDEMGFAPTTSCPDPEAYAIEWRRKITDALENYRKQSENAIVLPCKVGDTVYHCCEALGGILTYLVEAFNISLIGENGYCSWEAFAHDIEKDELLDVLDFDIDDIGKIVFFSRVEAEAALKGGEA